MQYEPDLILQKRVDWSMLNWGIPVPMNAWNLLRVTHPEIMVHGASMPIKLLINGQLMDAALINQNFSLAKFGDHNDLIQIRYSKLVANQLQKIFYKTYNYILPLKEGGEYKHRKIAVPDDLHESVRLCVTSTPSVFALDCYTDNEYQDLETMLKEIPEEIYETNNEELFLHDANAHIEQRETLVKYRKMDQSIIRRLKMFYGYRCQITGEKIGDTYGDSVVEAHHIDYFTKSQNNDSSNIIVISPNYHRIIHKNNPHFNRNKFQFEFENGELLSLKLYAHLKAG